MLRDIRDLIDDHRCIGRLSNNGDRPIASASYVFASHR
jgi:hypothetical protein